MLIKGVISIGSKIRITLLMQRLCTSNKTYSTSGSSSSSSSSSSDSDSDSDSERLHKVKVDKQHKTIEDDSMKTSSFNDLINKIAQENNNKNTVDIAIPLRQTTTEKKPRAKKNVSYKEQLSEAVDNVTNVLSGDKKEIKLRLLDKLSQMHSDSKNKRLSNSPNFEAILMTDQQTRKTGIIHELKHQEMRKAQKYAADNKNINENTIKTQHEYQAKYNTESQTPKNSIIHEMKKQQEMKEIQHAANIENINENIIKTQHEYQAKYNTESQTPKNSIIHEMKKQQEMKEIQHAANIENINENIIKKQHEYQAKYNTESQTPKNSIIHEMKKQQEMKEIQHAANIENINENIIKKQHKYQAEYNAESQTPKNSIIHELKKQQGTKEIQYVTNIENINEKTMNKQNIYQIEQIFKHKLTNSEAPELSTWKLLEQRELALLADKPPQNFFQEMIQWTESGKLWPFPIDNEYGMEQEHNVHFSEHVFLERHLKNWCPTRGPIRHFMELVCIGLSKNPYMTVDEKVEHITWYKDYFKGKEELLKELGAIDVSSSVKEQIKT